jgi:hypothetical protein
LPFDFHAGFFAGRYDNRLGRAPRLHSHDERGRHFDESCALERLWNGRDSVFSAYHEIARRYQLQLLNEIRVNRVESFLGGSCRLRAQFG